MREPADKVRAEAVRGIFSRIAGKYTLANRWMTWGQDGFWRKKVLELAHLPEGGMLLDLGTGTGDLALQAIHTDDSLFTIGADFTPEMMQVGRKRQGGNLVRWLNTDALNLPFCAESFDALVSGYLLRNVIDVNRVLAEQYRVLKSGGRMVSLDTSPPPTDMWHIPVRLYLKYFVPLIGDAISGDWKAYAYLADSTQHFMNAEELKARVVKAGFKEAGFHLFMGGSMAIHWGIK